MRWPTSNGITGCLGISLGPAYLANPEIRVEKYERDMNRHLGLLREEILQQKSVKKWAQSSLALRQVWHWAKRQPRIQSFGVLLGEEPGRKPNVHQSLRIMEAKCEDAFVEHFFLSLHELIVTKFSMKKEGDRWGWVKPPKTKTAVSLLLGRECAEQGDACCLPSKLPELRQQVCHPYGFHPYDQAFALIVLCLIFYGEKARESTCDTLELVLRVWMEPFSHSFICIYVDTNLNLLFLRT